MQLSYPRLSMLLLALLLILPGMAVCTQEQKHNDAPAPTPSPAIQQILDQVAASLKKNQRDEALQLAEAGVQKAKEAKDAVGEARCLREKALLIQQSGKSMEALSAWKEAAAAWEGVKDSPGQIEAFGKMALLLSRQSSGESAGLLDRAIALGQTERGRPLAAASVLRSEGRIFYFRGQVLESKRLCEAALAIQEKLAPDSLEIALSLSDMGIIARSRGDLSSAEDYHRRALAIRERLAPNSFPLAASFTSLGTIARSRGDLTTAENYHRQALVIAERLVPDSLELATILGNMGNVAHDRGDLSTAENYLKRALAIQERLAPGSVEVARNLSNLGHTMRSRGDLANAEEYLKRALAIQKRLAPDSLAVAVSLTNLAYVASGRGDLATAETYQTQALDIQKRLAPDSLAVAISLLNLGNLASQGENFAAAEDYLKQSQAIQERLASNSVAMATIQTNLGNAAYGRKDYSTAEGYYRQAMDIRERISPDSLQLANSLGHLGNVSLRQKLPAKALPLFQRAAEIIERQRDTIPDPESRRLFAEENTRVFSGLMTTYLLLDQPQQAYATLERARARAFVDSLAQRRFDLDQQLPADLKDRQIALNNQRSVAQNDLERALGKRNKPQEEAARKQIDTLAAQQRLLDTELRTRLPRFADFQSPHPLDLQGTQKTLDPGTLALCYFVDDDQSTLFAITDTSFHTYVLPIQQTELRRRILQALNALRQPGAVRNAYDPLLRSLYQTLLAPAQKEIAEARRLLICGQGPLLKLPFATLMPAPDRYLIQEKPLCYAASITAFQSLRREREGNHPAAALALGDPTYERLAAAPKLPAPKGKQMGRGLTPLPRTGPLARAVGALFAPSSDVLLGREATIANLKAKSAAKSVLHLGCHGWADEEDPLGSWLALTPQDKEDSGLLYAWQVLGMKLECDLVTLAACETGLGMEDFNEGILGLARAFQVAGAQSVLVSLWEVDEEATVQLMQDFYRLWKQGNKSKAEALQEAQLKLVGTNRAYLWAAFTLNGDWK